MSKMEGLETRRMLAAPFLRVGAVQADNRGEVVITLSERATGVKGAAVQLYTAGADGKLFTNDDKRESVRFTYSVNKKQIKLTANLKKDTPYRVKLDGKTRIKAEDDGTLLDGDFKGSLASGDGKAGGNFEAVFNRDRSNRPSAIFRTSAGDFTVNFRADVVPTTVSNVMSYMNTKRYDGTVLHRNGRTQSGGLQLPILQGGGFTYNNSNLTAITTDPAVPLEALLPNDQWTLAMARQNAPDTNTSQFFINVRDNPVLDSSDPNGRTSGYTVFATITSGTDVIETIYNNPTVALDNFFATNAPTFNGNPVTIYRAAPLMLIAAKS